MKKILVGYTVTGRSQKSLTFGKLETLSAFCASYNIGTEVSVKNT